MIPPPSPLNTIVNFTTVPSGTICPLWSKIAPVCTLIISPMRNSGMAVGSGRAVGPGVSVENTNKGVGIAVGREAGGRSRESVMTWFGLGLVISIKSYPVPGIETGEYPAGVATALYLCFQVRVPPQVIDIDHHAYILGIQLVADIIGLSKGVDR